MFYYQHHIGDFIKDTANLDDHQLATYLRMLWAYYTSEKPLTDDIDDLAFVMRSDEKTVRLLLRHFFNDSPEGWSHNRCDREIAEYHSKSEKARNSANARWKNTDAMRTHNERNADALVFDANQEPITKNHKLKRESATVVACPLDVSEQVWQDWLALRKAKKAAVTQTVLDGARKEAFKLDWPLEKFLVEWCTRGSQGLKAEWVSPKQTFAQQAADIARITVPGKQEVDPALIKIEKDRQLAKPPSLEVLAKMAELRNK
jgi:uncharacterized protein YdaU (DUF1376 family)